LPVTLVRGRLALTVPVVEECRHPFLECVAHRRGAQVRLISRFKLSLPGGLTLPGGAVDSDACASGFSIPGSGAVPKPKIRAVIPRVDGCHYVTWCNKIGYKQGYFRDILEVTGTFDRL
jgi:hypothetical protein